MTTIGVVGLGAMGLGIAQVFAATGFSVLATDANPSARATTRDRLDDTLALRLAAGKITQAQRDATLAHVAIMPAVAALSSADLVIEAIIEDRSAKSALFADLELVLPPAAVLATNTSSLSVTDLAQGLLHPERLVGLHFFNPAATMRLVELVAHDASSPEAVDLARRVSEAAGKTVIACSDSPGFVVNRCARPYYGEALALLEEGRSAAEIDGAMLSAGYRLGPFALIDLIGSDINLAATEGIYAGLGRHPRYYPFAALRRRVASGHLGRKSGMGFLYPETSPTAPADAAAIALRIEATLVNEAGWLLAAGGLSRHDIDTALRLGLNFPRGPFELLDHHGAARLRRTLVDLGKVAPPHLAGRYDLAPLLETT